MSITITNVSPRDRPDDVKHDYELRVGQDVIRFQHRRDLGLSAWLRRAAEAAEVFEAKSAKPAKDDKPPMMYGNGMGGYADE